MEYYGARLLCMDTRGTKQLGQQLIAYAFEIHVCSMYFIMQHIILINNALALEQ